MGSKPKGAKKLKVESRSKKVTEEKIEEAQEHVGTLKKLQEKDPEFYEFLKEHDKELLEFNEGDIEDDDDETERQEEEESEGEEEESEDHVEKEKEPSRSVISSEMVDAWLKEIHDGHKIGAVRSLLRAFRAACHYGDDSGTDATAKFSTMSSPVFNKIMSSVLNEMDGIFRGLMKLPPLVGKKETITELMATRKWKNYNHLVKSYLGNSLHVLNQMTDNEMIAFSLTRLRYSSVFLAAFPALLRKYVKVALHFWGTGSGALPVASFVFLRDLCIRLGSDCFDEIVKGMYKAYVLNCHFINATKLQHIQFLCNCFVEILQLDFQSAYQHAFTYIRQLAMILKDALSGSGKSKTKKGEAPPNPNKKKGKEAPSTSKKESYRKVYQWKYINCLELWTGVICANSSESDITPLAYPLTQIITGTARLLPSACHFPLRLRCVRMLNRISASTGTYYPVSLLLLDMLNMKELHKPPTGGVGKAVDMFSSLKVSKTALKTRGFQEACVSSVVEELTEHLAQWSYSIAFMEFSFVPSVRLRDFVKNTKVDRFRREMRSLIRQIETNSDFVNQKRTTISFLPNDTAASTFLEDEKRLGTSPLSKYVATLRQRAKDRSNALKESSMLVGDGSSKFGNRTDNDDDDDDDDGEDDDSENEGSGEFLLPGRQTKSNSKKDVKKKSKNASEVEAADGEDDIVEDFVLSSDDEEGLINDILNADDSESEGAEATPAQNGKKQNSRSDLSKDVAKNVNGSSKKRKSKKRKRSVRK